MLTLQAPAKINLTLEVLGKRSDGFHEIKSVVQTISLCDRLIFNLSDDISFLSSLPGWKAEESLVLKAVNLLREATGCKKGVSIEIEKSIPLFAGLGGDSSDGAATIIGLNRLWELKLPKEKMLELTAKLGSDVPLFLSGGTVLMEGKGEKVSELPPYPHMWLVILVPDVETGQGKTGQMYSRIKPSQYSDGGITDRLVGLLNGSEDMELIMNEFGITRERFTVFLNNVFDDVAPDYFKGLNAYWQKFIDAGAKVIHVCGSGPALYGLFETKDEASVVYSRLKEQVIRCFLVNTTGNMGCLS